MLKEQYTSFIDVYFIYTDKKKYLYQWNSRKCMIERIKRKYNSFDVSRID